MPSRAVDFDSGTAMIVTDLHGEGDAYYRLRDKFFALRAVGEADRLVLCGDLIHGYGAESHDASLDMLLDVMRLQSEFGADVITMLLGNHEMPHIYGLTLAKGNIEFTPRFEAALTRLDQRSDLPYRREDVINFFSRLPFYARTKAGVLLTHAGAAPMVNAPHIADRLLNFDHDALIEHADTTLTKYDINRLYLIYVANTGGVLYEEQARHFLAVSGPDDPRYNHLLREMVLDKSDDFKLLWDVLFSVNERLSSVAAYERVLLDFLAALNEFSPHEQRVVLAGHISARDGCEMIGAYQMRLASYAHAQPRERGRYLLLDCAKRIDIAEDLRAGLRLTDER
jgi:hypothetical protein